MTAHAILSPSSAYRWMNCPGSARLCAAQPRTSSKYAEEGSAAHRMAEVCLTGGSLNDFDGRSLLHVGEGWSVLQRGAENPMAWPVTDEMLAAVGLYLALVDETLKLAGKHARLTVENKLDLGWLVPGMFGTADAVVHAPMDTLRVIDYKHGQGVLVSPENNPQAMIYALGVLGEGNNWGADEVELIICQPRAREGDSVKRWLVDVDHLYAWAKEELKPAAMAAMKDGASLKQGDWCKFCDAKVVCPEVAGAMFGVIQKPSASPLEPGSEVVLPAPGFLSPEQISRALELAGIISSWSEAVQEYAKDRLRTGQAVPGWKLVAGRKTRAWESEDAVRRSPLYITLKGDVFDMKIKSVAQMEKTMKEKGLSLELMNPLVKVSQGVSLAPASDKRLALDTAEQLFGALK